MPDGNAAASRVINNAKILRDLGHQVVLVDVCDQADENILKTQKTVFSFTCYSIQYPKKLGWVKYLTSINKIKKLLKETKFDSIIVYNYPSVALMRLLQYCKKRSIKLIADCTEWYPNSKNIIKNADTYLRMNYLQKKIDGVIAISQYLFDFYKTNVKTIYLPPLVDCNDEKWQNDNIEENKKMIFTYAGSLGRKKDNLPLFFDALKQQDSTISCLFVIIGITEKQFLELYPGKKELIQSLNGKVEFLGRISHKDALNRLKQSTFSVFIREPNRANTAGFPTKFVEAVSCGVPVMTNLTSDLASYLHDMENGIVIEECSKEKLSKAFEKAFSLSNKQLFDMKTNCENKKETFHYEFYKDEMKKLFGEENHEDFTN